MGMGPHEIILILLDSDGPVDIEVRIRVLDSIYAKTVHLAAGHGSKGGGDRNHDPSWVRVNAAEIMGLQ